MICDFLKPTGSLVDDDNRFGGQSVQLSCPTILISWLRGLACSRSTNYHAGRKQCLLPYFYSSSPIEGSTVQHLDLSHLGLDIFSHQKPKSISSNDDIYTKYDKKLIALRYRMVKELVIFVFICYYFMGEQVMLKLCAQR
jgi:hypothetical protein